MSMGFWLQLGWGEGREWSRATGQQAKVWAPEVHSAVGCHTPWKRAHHWSGTPPRCLLASLQTPGLSMWPAGLWSVFSPLLRLPAKRERPVRNCLSLRKHKLNKPGHRLAKCSVLLSSRFSTFSGTPCFEHGVLSQWRQAITTLADSYNYGKLLVCMLSLPFPKIACKKNRVKKLVLILRTNSNSL